jgi:hypothetical protein
MVEAISFNEPPLGRYKQSLGGINVMAFLNADLAAKEFGLSVAAIRSAAKTGRLPGSRKIGGRWFVHTETLVKYFENAPTPCAVAPSTGAAA